MKSQASRLVNVAFTVFSSAMSFSFTALTVPFGVPALRSSHCQAAARNLVAALLKRAAAGWLTPARSSWPGLMVLSSWSPRARKSYGSTPWSRPRTTR